MQINESYLDSCDVNGQVKSANDSVVAETTIQYH